MTGSKKVFTALAILGLLVIAANMPAPPDAKQSAATAGPKFYKDKLVPEKVFNIHNDRDHGLVGIMVGTGDDGEHFVSIAMSPRDIREGVRTAVSSSVVTAYNGKENRFAHSPQKYGTTMEITINSLSHKERTATITVSGRLIADRPGGGPYLEIVPVTLRIQGEQFDQLVAS